MICQNCQSKVDDDLIFCMNCGARMFEPQGAAPTVAINDPAATNAENIKPPTVLANDSVVTQIGKREPAPPKPASNLKWVALILALIAIPATIFGVFLLLRSKNQPAASQNTAKTPAATPTRSKANTNQTANFNISNANANKTPENTPSPKPAAKTDIMNERIEIAPNDHYAVPFEVEADTARMTGKVTILEGGKVHVLLYIQSEFDSYFPDPVHKVAGLETSNSEDWNQVIVQEKYVLVFINQGDKQITIQGNFRLEAMEKPSN